MSVEQSQVVDAIGIDKKMDEVMLTISDHLEWDADNEHLLILQEKINSYLAFIESGEILKSYPLSAGKKCVISLICLYHPTEEALKFLAIAQKIVERAGIGFQFKQSHFNSPP